MKKTIKFKKIDPLAVLPSKKNEDDAGYDLTSIETLVIPAKAQQVIKTGLELADCPKGHVIQIWPRSGLDAKFALHTGAGVVDAIYRGEVLVCLKNMNTVEYEVKAGDKIAQFLVIKLADIQIEEAEEVSESSRGKSGGITGFKSQEVKFIDDPDYIGPGYIVMDEVSND